ncbi:tetratricopeptide repeat protein [Vibrio sp. 10N.222.49.A3]|uniref:tetratricopeptide repeat protein n=1 Tax=Vibrio sp. 10N.222.49.A3 TaxID=3229611 RepID=UPI00355158CD
MIIWVTLKANRLTASGVIQLRDAIVSTLGLYQDIGKALGFSSDSTIEEMLEEISIYMKEFNVLLCIDNLETIEKQSVRSFLAEIPEGSKVLITTRIGLGEIEYRYKLDSLDSKSSIELIRKLSRLLNIESLKKKNKLSLENLARKLHHNPLLIKWYVLGLGSGKRNEDLLNKESVSYQEALKFCFQNLYEKLDPVELDIIKTIACLRNSVSAVELRFILDDRGEMEIAEALHNLNNSSMLKSDISKLKEEEGIKTYTLTNIASDYLTTVNPISDDFYADVKSKHKALKRHIESSLTDHNYYHLDITNIHATNKDEKICAVYLKRALTLSRKEETYEEAIELVKKAKAIKPDFSECYRVNAFLHHKSPFKAEAEYEAAIEYNSKSVIAFYAFSQYLMHEEEYPYALEQIDKAIALKQSDEALLSFKALVLTRSGEYPEAIDLYEKILPVQRENQHRKFRISTYQQVISAYKRYTERLVSDHDYPQSETMLNRVCELFHEVFDTCNFDDRTFVLFWQVVVLSDKVDFQNKNIAFTTKMIELLDNYKDVFSAHHKMKVCTEFRAIVDKLFTESKDRFEILCQDFELIMDGDDQLYHGSIKDVVCKARNNLSYGFIVGDDSTEYFFHRGEIIPHDVLDNNEEYKGLRVAFYACSKDRSRGPIAKSVRLI